MHTTIGTIKYGTVLAGEIKWSSIYIYIFRVKKPFCAKFILALLIILRDSRVFFIIWYTIMIRWEKIRWKLTSLVPFNSNDNKIIIQNPQAKYRLNFQFSFSWYSVAHNSITHLEHTPCLVYVLAANAIFTIQFIYWNQIEFSIFN